MVCSCPDPLAPTSRSFPVVRCGTCGTGYVSEAPSPGELRRYYSTEYRAYRAGSSASARVWTRVLSVLLREEVGSSLGLALFPPESGSNAMLDVGIGGGSLTSKMMGRGWNAYGLDFTHDLAAQLPEGMVQFVVGHAGHLPFRDRSFDLVIASHVLEHLHDPVHALTEYARVLRPGGRVSLGVPNFDSFPSVAFHRATYAYLDVPRHLVFFTDRSLRLAIRQSGLSLAGFRTVPAPALLPTSLLKIGLNPRVIQHRWVQALVSGASLPFDIVTQRNGRGCNFTAVAVKPPNGASGVSP